MIYVSGFYNIFPEYAPMKNGLSRSGSQSWHSNNPYGGDGRYEPLWGSFVVQTDRRRRQSWPLWGQADRRGRQPGVIS